MTTCLQACGHLSAALRRSYVGGSRGDGSERGVCVPNLRSVRKSYLLYGQSLPARWRNRSPELINTAVFAARLLRRKGIVPRFKEQERVMKATSADGEVLTTKEVCHLL